jgi:type I restriction-modification system DNA methylase subunit
MAPVIKGRSVTITMGGVKVGTFSNVTFGEHKPMKRLSEAAVKVLGSMETTPFSAIIKSGQLDKKLYAEVNKALEAIGGKWDRKLKAHQFRDDPRDAIDQVLFSGGFTDTKKEFGFFETPLSVADQMAELLKLQPGMSVLEPSAGRGRLANACERQEVPNVTYTLVELQGKNVDALLLAGYNGRGDRVIHDDFLTYRLNEAFDRVIMNPPFARQADIDHVKKALFHTKPGGRLVAIMSAGVMFRENNKTLDFKQMLSDNCSSFGFETLPEGTFTESGTNTNTVMLVADKA